MESNRKQGGKSRYSKKPGFESGSNYSGRKDDTGSGDNFKRGGRFSGKEHNSGYSRKRGEGYPKQSRGRRKENTKPLSDEIRLNRYIANSGVCSRREADELIRRGEIFVNGKQITELGTKVKLTDNVVYKEKRLVPEHKVYILMNKPKGYVTTVEDPHAEHTVIDLLGDNFPERVYPVGRLDKDTTGVLLLTNDGDLTKKLTHPKFERKKIYHLFLDKEITKKDIFALAEGVDVDGEIVAADAVSTPDPDDRTQLGIEIHSGQNRIVRRMMESLGYRVKKLDRVYFAGLTKKNVQRGKWRFLTDKEIIMLKRGAF
ncbi:MAG TPA: rRNA pseudouridine synthase [Bacteroidetes bacterium]|nr:rRNA pseudouridine synthase [Bacteroidota bacterium]